MIKCRNSSLFSPSPAMSVNRMKMWGWKSLQIHIAFPRSWILVAFSSKLPSLLCQASHKRSNTAKRLVITQGFVRCRFVFTLVNPWVETPNILSVLLNADITFVFNPPLPPWGKGVAQSESVSSTVGTSLVLKLTDLQATEWRFEGVVRSDFLARLHVSLMSLKINSEGRLDCKQSFTVESSPRPAMHRTAARKALAPLDWKRVGSKEKCLRLSEIKTLLIEFQHGLENKFANDQSENNCDPNHLQNIR